MMARIANMPSILAGGLRDLHIDLYTAAVLADGPELFRRSERARSAVGLPRLAGRVRGRKTSSCESAPAPRGDSRGRAAECSNARRDAPAQPSLKSRLLSIAGDHSRTLSGSITELLWPQCYPAVNSRIRPCGASRQFRSYSFRTGVGSWPDSSVHSGEGRAAAGRDVVHRMEMYPHGQVEPPACSADLRCGSGTRIRGERQPLSGILRPLGATLSAGRRSSGPAASGTRRRGGVPIPRRSRAARRGWDPTGPETSRVRRGGGF